MNKSHPIGVRTARALIASSALLTLTALGSAAAAAVTSENHPVLKRHLAAYPDADGDGDLVLTFAEYAAHLKTLPPRKQENGKPAGPISTLLPNGEMLVTDFDENNLGKLREWGWEIQGDAFRHDLNQVAKNMRQRVGNFSGRYFVSSLLDSDSAVGKIVSPPFTLELNYLTFLISGGDFPGEAGIDLLIDGQVVRSAAGKNDDLFEKVAFDVRAFVGREARIQIIDDHRGFWGHVNADRIAQGQTADGFRTIAKKPDATVRKEGFFITRSGRTEGTLTPGADLDEVLLALSRNDSESKVKSAGALHLKSGEVWRGDVVGFDKDAVKLRSPLFGEREVPLDQIATVQLRADAKATGEPGHLYRTDGPPIPGTLVWIRDKDIAIDCALGVVPIPREKVLSFINAKPEPASAAAGNSEIGLTDGSILRGAVAGADDKLKLAHPAIGELSLPLASVRYLRGGHGGVIWLDALPMKVLRSHGPAMPPPPPSVIGSDDDSFLHAVRILPDTKVNFDLPDAHSQQRLSFHARLAPVAGCRTGLHLKIANGTPDGWNRALEADAEPFDIAIDLPAGTGEMEIGVIRTGPLAFPCGVEIRDAYFLTAAGPPGAGTPENERGAE